MLRRDLEMRLFELFAQEVVAAAVGVAVGEAWKGHCTYLCLQNILGLFFVNSSKVINNRPLPNCVENHTL